MRWPKALLCVLLLALAASPAGAADPTFPERGRSAVVDAAGVIPDAVEAELNARIVAWVHTSGHQLAVVTVPGLEGYAIEDYGNRLLRHWGLGRDGADDGAILLLAPHERQVRIEVGYGLEGVLTDALSHRIIAETIQPALGRDDIAGALSAGADRIMAAATLDPAEARAMTLAAEQATQRRGPSLGLILLIGIPVLIVVGLVGIAVYEDRRRKRRIAEDEEKRKSRLRRQWEKQKSEARTPFATFEAYYADFLAREKAKEDERIRKYLERHANDPVPSASESASGSSRWSSSDNSDWSGGSSSSSWDSGFDSGGGSGGGGGASGSY